MGWRRVVIVVGVALVVPRCTCAPPCSNHQAPHATFDVAQGCAGYYCAMSCDPGWFDCNNEEGDGCETPGACPEIPDAKLEASDDAGPRSLVTTSSVPRGLVACAGRVFFLDGSTLRSIDTSTLAVTTIVTVPDTPARGLACDGAYVYWATLATVVPDASTPDGVLYRTAVNGNTAIPIASGIDPASGIDTRDGGVYLMTTSGLALHDGDAGLVPWMPASESIAYKAFALGSGEDWSLDHATIVRRTDDAGAASWIDDAGSPSAIVLDDAGEPIVVLHGFGDGGSDLFAYARDDAGLPALSPIDASVHPIVATTGGDRIIAASDDTIYAVAAGAVKPIQTSNAHIVDVVAFGPWVYWTTSNPPGLWRGAIP